MPQVATLEDIQNIKKLFVDSALRAKKANYDALELHVAHGYFLYEFLSPLTNKREDIYGGTLENRCRLILEITQELIEKVKLPSAYSIFCTLASWREYLKYSPKDLVIFICSNNNN